MNLVIPPIGPAALKMSPPRCSILRRESLESLRRRLAIVLNGEWSQDPAFIILAKGVLTAGMRFNKLKRVVLRLKQTGGLVRLLAFFRGVLANLLKSPNLSSYQCLFFILLFLSSLAERAGMAGALLRFLRVVTVAGNSPVSRTAVGAG